MNKTYQLIWNAVQQVWVVASELGKARKKTRAAPALTALMAGILCTGTYAAGTAPPALPTLNNIAFGAASLTTTAGSLTVDQTTDKLIANWNSFDVGVNAKVTFNQPSGSSIALNRVAGTEPSKIFGQIQANGQLILVNPAGTTFGNTAQLNAASVIASTLDITDTNFLSNNLQFDRGTATGSISNEGIIQASGGDTYVFASNISNSGTIRSKDGNINLANGNRLTINNMAGIAVVNQVSSVASVIRNSGLINGVRLTTGNKGKVYIKGDRARTHSIVDLAGEVSSTGNYIKGRVIHVSGATVVNASTNLNAIRTIHINDALSINSNKHLISLTYDHNSHDGLSFGDNGKISMPGNATRYRDNGTSYTLIKTLTELQAIGRNRSALAGHYALAMDIDASSTASIGFTPIGSSKGIAFSGVLNGLGNSINSLTINKPNKNEVGLIGFNQFGSVKNISLANIAVSGQNYVGGLIGRNGTVNILSGDSIISGNRVSGSISGKQFVGGLVGANAAYGTSTSTITNNSSAASISGNYNVGGLIGVAETSRQGTFNLTGNHVQGTTQASASMANEANLGGLIGKLFNLSAGTSSIRNNIVNGNVTLSGSGKCIAGGIGQISNDDATLRIDNNQINGNVSATASSNHMGGLIGILSNDSSDAPASISNNLTTGDVSAGSYIGGLIGLSYGNDHTTVTGNRARGNVSGQNNVGGLLGESNNINIIRSNHATGDIHATGNAGGLIGNNFDSPVSDSYATGNIFVAQSGNNIGGLVGQNYGAAAAISKSYASGNIQVITNAGTASYAIGGLVGSNIQASIRNSYATGNVNAGPDSSDVGGLAGLVTTDQAITSLDSNFATGNVYGNSNIGGLYGNMYNYNNATVRVSNSYSKGNVTGRHTNVGGLVGSYTNSSGKLYLSNSYASGQLTGSDTASRGGLIGFAEDGAGISYLSNSFWNKSVTGLDDAIGFSALNHSVTNLKGLSTAQTLQQASYTGWDISDQPGGSSVWYIQEGVSAPQLR